MVVETSIRAAELNTIEMTGVEMIREGMDRMIRVLLGTRGVRGRKRIIGILTRLPWTVPPSDIGMRKEIRGGGNDGDENVDLKDPKSELCLGFFCIQKVALLS